jgi:hypothetical protein
MAGATHSLPRSGKFLAPGAPIQPERMMMARQVLHEGLQSIAGQEGLRLIQNGDTIQYIPSAPPFSLTRCCELAEHVLKSLLKGFSADLIGGANVTRLDRVLTHEHPRIPYRRALRIVDGRGWHLNLGDDLPPAAQASLIRFCGHLPVQVLYLPGQPQPASRRPRTQGFTCIVPWGGQVIQAVAPLEDGVQEASLRLRIDGLLRLVLGLPE